jgi:hypothetical protein
MKSFKPKKIEDPDAEIARPTAAEIAQTIGPLTGKLIPTTPLPAPAPASSQPQAAEKAEPSLMMSFKASKSFARMLAKDAQPIGGLRRLIARVFLDAGYPVPEVDLKGGSKRRRTYD